MAERGIIFSAPMVRALLDGRKVQTRRLLTGAPQDKRWHCDPADTPSGYRFVAEGGTPSLPINLPHAVGDRLYVREAFCAHWGSALPDGATHISSGQVKQKDGSFVEIADSDIPLGVWYRADKDEKPFPHSKWTPSIHMPRWASRLTLTVTDVRVQRLQEISEEDAIAEGALTATHLPNVGAMSCNQARQAFADLWNSLHDKPGTRWEDNPWLYALTFDVAPGNIDRVRG